MCQVATQHQALGMADRHVQGVGVEQLAMRHPALVLHTVQVAQAWQLSASL